MTTVAALLAYDPSQVKPGWIALVVVLILCVATFLLWRSMNTQLGKIRVPPGASFDNPGSDSRTPTEADESDRTNGGQPPPG